MAMNTSGDSFMSSMVTSDDLDVPRSCSRLTPMNKLLIVVASECSKLEQELQSNAEFQENLDLNKEANSEHKLDDDDDAEEEQQEERVVDEESSSKNEEQEEEEGVTEEEDELSSKNSKNQRKEEKKISNSNNQMMLTGPHPPPDLPEEFKNMINELGGTETTLVIQKSLYKSDLNPGNSRLSMPLSQIRADFLKESEKRIKEITVPLIQPSLEIIDVILVKWIMPKESGAVSITYNLKTAWMKVVKANKLKEGHVIQVWSFRVQEELFMALVKVT